MDAQFSASRVFYRIKSVDLDGKYSYSPVVSLNAGNASIVLKAFPMPAQNQITLQHPAATATTRITLNTEDGRMVKSILPSNGTLQTMIDLSSVKSGLYLVRFENGNGEVETMKIIKQ